MPTSVSWNGSSRSIPNAGELSWQALTGFLVDLGNNAQTTNFQKVGMRVATSSPVTVAAASDCVVVTNLGVAGAVAVNLPAGVTGQMFCIVDGKGDAATNNITITPAAGNINGAATYAINGNRNGIIIAYNGTEWTILSEFLASGTAGSIPRDQLAAGTAGHVIINDGSGVLSSEAQLAITRGGTGAATAPAGFDALAPTTTRGDLVTRNASSNVSLGIGAASTVLKSDGTDPAWAKIVDANVDAAAAIARSKVAAGTASHVVTNDGSGVLSSEAQLAPVRGGTGQDFSASTGVIKVSAGTVSAGTVGLGGADVSGTLPIGSGGTGQTTLPAAFDALAPTTTKGDLIASDGSDNVRVAVGVNGQVLVADSAASSGVAWSDVGGGSGEKNYIENHSALSVITGWNNVGDLDVARTTTGAELPREFTTGAGVKITANSGTQSTADYVYYDFTLDDVDLNKKLKIQWSQKTTGTYVAGDLAVIITTQADRTTAVATPVTTAVPAADGVFSTSFDTASTATLSLVIRATTDMATSGGIVISDVIVGPGIQPQGAVVGEWQSYTPTWGSTGTAPAIGNGTLAGQWRRVGDTAEVAISVRSGTTTTYGTGVQTWSMPTGLSIDSARLPNGAGSYSVLGVAAASEFGGNYYTGSVVYSNSDTVVATTNNIASGWGGTSPFTPTASEAGNGWDLRFTAPITSFAGSGTVNVAQNDALYVSHDGTSVVFGPAGAVIPTGTPAGTNDSYSLTAAVAPISSGDAYILEFAQSASGPWVSQSSDADQLHFDGTNYIGAGADITSSTGLVIRKGKYRSGMSTTWGTITAGVRWRVRKSSAGAAVGFGLATSTSSGLVNPYIEGSGVIYSARYTPALTGVANVAATGAHPCHYTRVGKIVTVSGVLDVTTSAAGATTTQVGISLPVASALTSSTDVSGTGARSVVAGNEAAVVSADTVNDRAEIMFRSTDTSILRSVLFTFQYEIK